MLNISNFNTNITLETNRDSNDDDDMMIKVDKIISRDIIHTKKLLGTTPQWRYKKSESKTSSFYSSYINKQEVSLFHTGIRAE